MSKTVDREEVQRLLQQGAQLVEVLGHDEYEAEHLPGAINIPLKAMDRDSATRLLQPDRPMIVYCFDYQ